MGADASLSILMALSSLAKGQLFPHAVAHSLTIYTYMHPSRAPRKYVIIRTRFLAETAGLSAMHRGYYDL